jgi:hypothetical protein
MHSKTRLEQELEEDFKSYKRDLEHDIYEDPLTRRLEEESRNIPKEISDLLDAVLNEHVADYSLELTQAQSKQKEISNSEDSFCIKF